MLLANAVAGKVDCMFGDFVIDGESQKIGGGVRNDHVIDQDLSLILLFDCPHINYIISPCINYRRAG